MATIIYTPNLNLKISSDDDAITKYNLNRIDYLAQKINIAVGGDTVLSSTTNISINAVYGLGVNRYNGTITIDAGNLGTFDTSSLVRIIGRQFQVTTGGGTISLEAATIDLNGAVVSNQTLPENNLLIGNSSDLAAETDTSSVGDILADASTGLTIKEGVVSDANITDVDSSKVTGLAALLDIKADITYVDAQDSVQNAYTALVQASLNAHKADSDNPHNTTAAQVGAYTTSQVDGYLNYKADQASLDAHTSDSDNPHSTTASQVGAYTKEQTDALIAGVAGGKVFVSSEDTTPDYLDAKIAIGTGLSKTITGAGAGEKLQINNTDTGSAAMSSHLNAFQHSDIAHENRTALDNVSGTNTGDETSESIKTKLGSASGAADGYLTSSDWTTFNGKEPAVTKGDLTGVANRTSVTGGTGAVIGSGASVDIDTSLLPSPGAGDTGKALIATGANAASWTTVSVSDEKIKISATDTTAEYLGTKIAIGAGLLGAIENPGENEYISIENIDTGSAAISTHESSYNHTEISHTNRTDLDNVSGTNTGDETTDSIKEKLGEASSVSDGYLNSTDWNTFNGKQDSLASMFSATGEPTGFEDPANVGIAYDSTARTITLTHSSGTLAYWIAGTRYTRVSPFTSAAHSATNGSYYYSFAAGNVPTWTSSFPGFDSGAYTAYVNYGASDKFAIRECHGLMQWQSWQNAHLLLGTYRKSGGLVTAGTYALNTNTVAAVTPGFDLAVVSDEDLDTTIPVFTDGSTYTTLHFDNGIAVFTPGSTFPYRDSGTNIQYNQNPISGTALSSMTTSNRWVNIYGIMIPVTSDAGSQSYRWVWMLGQQIYTSLTSAQAEDFRSLYTGNLTTIFPEFVPWVRLTYLRTTSSNTRNAHLNAEPAYLSGSRASFTTISGFTPSTSPATRYSASLSWSGVGPYTMTIAGSSHQRGADPIVQVLENTTGTTYEIVYPDVTKDSSTGDVTITSTSNFTGSVVIL